MKVMCISDIPKFNDDSGAKFAVTIGKVYEIKSVEKSSSNNRYFIVNDIGVMFPYPTYIFINISEHRNNRINEIIN